MKVIIADASHWVNAIVGLETPSAVVGFVDRTAQCHPGVSPTKEVCRRAEIAADMVREAENWFTDNLKVCIEGRAMISTSHTMLRDPKKIHDIANKDWACGGRSKSEHRIGRRCRKENQEGPATASPRETAVPPIDTPRGAPRGASYESTTMGGTGAPSATTSEGRPGGTTLTSAATTLE